VISAHELLARALLGAGEEDEVEFEVGNRIRTVTVLGIDKVATMGSRSQAGRIEPAALQEEVATLRRNFRQDSAEDADSSRRPQFPDEISSRLWRRLAEWSVANGKFDLGNRGLLFLIAELTIVNEQRGRKLDFAGQGSPSYLHGFGAGSRSASGVLCCTRVPAIRAQL